MTVVVAAVRAVAGYQTAVTELAFLRDAMRRGTAGGDAPDRHQELLLNLRVVRAAAVGALGAVPADIAAEIEVLPYGHPREDPPSLRGVADPFGHDVLRLQAGDVLAP